VRMDVSVRRAWETKERYAEVLGHELAHAATSWATGSSLRLYQDLGERGRKYDAVWSAGSPADELEMRLAKIERLTREFERPARSAELDICRELLMAGAAPRELKPVKRQNY